MNDQLGSAAIPGLPPGLFHFGISRRFPLGEALKTLIDEELARMEASGRLQSLLKAAFKR